jgi:hypothetical protein
MAKWATTDLTLTALITASSRVGSEKPRSIIQPSSTSRAWHRTLTLDFSVRHRFTQTTVLSLARNGFSLSYRELVPGDGCMR